MTSCRLARTAACLSLALLLCGCATEQTVEVPPHPDAIPQNTPLAASDVEAAEAALAKHIGALASGDLQAVLDTTPESHHDGYRSDIETRSAWWEGYRVRSMMTYDSDDPRVKSRWGDYVNRRLGYRALAIIQVRGESSDSTHEEFDAYMALTPEGRWLFLDSGF